MIKKRFFSFIAIVCLQLLYIIALFGNTFHVESNGNDITGDGSQENPWKTLSFACSQVTSFGNTIYVKAGMSQIMFQIMVSCWGVLGVPGVVLLVAPWHYGWHVCFVTLV